MKFREGDVIQHKTQKWIEKIIKIDDRRVTCIILHDPLGINPSEIADINWYTIHCGFFKKLNHYDTKLGKILYGK